jgi:hypothetical protein
MKKTIALTVFISCFIGWGMNSMVRGGTSVPKVCISQDSQISRKNSCSTGEIEVANNSVKKKKISKRLMNSGTHVLKGGLGPRTVAHNQTLTGAVGQSVRSYTYALTFVSRWNGRITLGCGSFEVPITSTAVAYMNGVPVPTEDEADPNGGLYFADNFLSYRTSNAPYHFLSPRFDGGLVTSQQAWLDEQGLQRPENYVVDPDWPDGLVVYVTQICAPLTELASR